MTPGYWLIKFAPFRTSWTEILARGSFTLRGIRSPEARKHLRAMRLGDQVLFYHSQQDQAVVGVMEVTREACSDPTSADPQWLTCDFRALRSLPRPIPRPELLAHPGLTEFLLLRRPRLSVMPVTPREFATIVDL